MKVADMIALALVIIGGLNWLLVGLFEFDLVASLFGGQEAILSKIVYILVGIAALYSLKFFKHINDHYEVPHAAGAGMGGTTSSDTPVTEGATKTTDSTADRDASGASKDPNVNEDVSGTDRAGDPNNPDDPNNRDSSLTEGATKTTDSTADRDASGASKDPNVNEDVSGTDRAGDPDNPDDPNSDTTRPR